MIDAVAAKRAYQIFNNEIEAKKPNETAESQTTGAAYDLNAHQALWQHYHYQQEDEGTMNQQEENKNVFPSEVDCAFMYNQGYDVEAWCASDFNDSAKKSTRVIDESLGSVSLQQKIERLKTHTDSMYREALKQDEITINSLYKASFTGNKKTVFDFTKEDVNQVLGMNGLAPTEGNTAAASKLMSWQMDVTKEDVIKLQNIEASIKSLPETEEINLGQDASDALMMKDQKVLYTDMTIKEVIDDLTKVDEKTLQDTAAREPEVTINNLRATMLENTEHVLKGQSKQEEVSEEKIADLKTQIREIRAMLTSESAMKLSEKMPLESSELAKVAEGLRQIQNETFEHALEKAEIPVTEENKAQLSQVLEAQLMIGRNKEAAMTIKIDEPLESLHQALIAYEESSSVPEARFGETLQKVEGQISTFLESNQLPTDQASLEAAKALIANELALTVENLEGAKGVLGQLQVIIDELSPYEAAKMIKEGINPYTASLSHLVQWVEASELPKQSERIASAIVTLEEQGQITADQKSSLIGLYRILQGATNHKDQVVGYMFKNNLPLTVEHLGEAIQYTTKTRHFERQSDHNMGEVEEVIYSKETARQLLINSETERKRMIDVAKLLEEMEFPLSRENLDKATTLSTAIYPLLKDMIKQQLGKFEGLDVLPERIKEKLEAVKTIDKSMVDTMEKHGVELTLNNLYWMKKIYDQPDVYSSMLKTLEQERHFPESLEAFEKELEKCHQEASEAKSDCMADGDLLGYRQYKQLEEMTAVQKQLIDKEGVYQIPFVIQGEARMVNLYLKQNKHAQTDGQKSGLDAVISYDTKALGNVRAYMHLEKDRISYQIIGETPEATKKLQKDAGSLVKILEKMGFEVGKTTFKTEAEDIKPVTLALKGDSQFEMMA